ncbi:S1C family serine protease [Bosea eneae]|uniref:S1C family serine protease n=1 Tax=Bosea eneae TaxID=151454 RepID=A0ABW0J055_9HYPH
MKRVMLGIAIFAGLTAVAIGLLPSTPISTAPVASGSIAAVEAETIALFRRSAPAVVHVFAQGQSLTYVEQAQSQQTGSGFLWDTAGHIVTNEHVVRGADVVRVRLADGRLREGRVVGRAGQVDLAVIKINGGDLPAPLPVGTSASLAVGQFVMAIGNPFGLDQTLTTGVVSALKRRLPTESGREIADMIQTDAAINPGNSGGPLIDGAGQLIGVATAIYSPSGASAGIGFAVPVDTVRRVVPMLIADGRIPTPAIGVVVAPEATAARHGIDGLIVSSVLPNSPAQRAGIRGIDRVEGLLGDVIVSIDGKPVRRLAELTEALEAAGVGKIVAIGILRRENTISLRVRTVDGGS